MKNKDVILKRSERQFYIQLKHKVRNIHLPTYEQRLLIQNKYKNEESIETKTESDIVLFKLNGNSNGIRSIYYKRNR